MSEIYVATIRTEIERAYAVAEAGQFSCALRSFALARAMSVEMADQKALQAAITRDVVGFEREREVFRGKLSSPEKVADPFLIFADSLGLPRPDQKSGPTLGGSATYPWLISEAQPTRRIDSICQRYFTTQDIVKMLHADPSLGVGADVLIHVGLNDCSNRMFLHDQRLSLNLLPEELRIRIVGFAQKYRARILKGLPPSHYVAPDAFRTNLDQILAMLKARKARKIALTTIILPPSRFWPGTIGMNRNFAAYNLEIMTAAERHSALLLDLDRYVWQDIPSGPLLEDGMHLSAVGHKLMAAKAVELLGRKLA